MTREEAIATVEAELHRRFGNPDNPLVVDDARTIEKSYGWVLFYVTKRFMQTRRFEDMLAGNGPVVVRRDTGEMSFFGTAKPWQELVAELERAHRL
jgi:hypothetical protein